MRYSCILAVIIIMLVLTSCAPAATNTPVTPLPTGTQITDTPEPVVVPNTPTPTWEMPVVPQAAIGDSITVLPYESVDVIINPGKGWILYYPYKDQSQEIWDAIALCYSRLEWNWLEPVEGQIDWSIIDDSVEICADHGKQFAFGIMAANSSSWDETVIPEWVFTAGAQKGEVYDGANNNTLIAPVWNDPVYLEKMQNLITAMAERYDGDANIAFIDARNCGNWGEWHSLGCDTLSNQDKAALVDQWNVFKETTIIIPTNGDFPEYQVMYGTEKYGFGVRRDSAETHQNAAGYAFDKAPAVAEWGASYEEMKNCAGWSGVCWSPDLLPSFMNKSYFSYIPLGGWNDAQLFFDENPDLVKEWANQSGYWFKLSEVTYPANLGNGSSETLSFQVKNDGVAPIYVNKNNTFVRLALLDLAGLVLSVSDPLEGVNPFDWKPGENSTITVEFNFPETPNAAYLAIGLFSNANSTEPDIKLGNVGVLPNNWFPIHGDIARIAPLADQSSPESTTTPTLTTEPDSAVSNANAILGYWTGIENFPDGSGGTQVDISINPDCVVGSVCGTIVLPQFGCSGNIVLSKIIDGNTFVVIEEFTSGGDGCVSQSGGSDYLTLQADGTVSLQYYFKDGTAGGNGTLSK